MFDLSGLKELESTQLKFLLYYHMNIKDFVQAFPFGLRDRVRKILASEIGISISLIRSWETGERKIKPRYYKLIEKATEGKVDIKIL